MSKRETPIQKAIRLIKDEIAVGSNDAYEQAYDRGLQRAVGILEDLMPEERELIIRERMYTQLCFNTDVHNQRHFAEKGVDKSYNYEREI